MSKRKSYDASFKLQILEYAKKESKRAAARKFSVHEQRVRDWVSTSSDLEKLLADRKRMAGAGPKLIFTTKMEDELVAWIEQSRSHHFGVTCKAIQLKADEIFKCP